MKRDFKDIFLFMLVLPMFMLAAEVLYSHGEKRDQNSPLLSSICLKIEEGRSHNNMGFGVLLLKAYSVDKSLHDTTQDLIKLVKNAGEEYTNPLTPMGNSVPL